MEVLDLTMEVLDLTMEVLALPTTMVVLVSMARHHLITIIMPIRRRIMVMRRMAIWAGAVA